MKRIPECVNIIFILSLLGSSIPSLAHELSGYFGVDARLFRDPPLFSDQARHNASLTTQLEYYHDSEDLNERVAITLFGRGDGEDTDRSHIDFREFFWLKNFENTELYAGVRKIFWGVTESVHLVDIINQTDVLENIDGEDKLGQPMLQLTSTRDWGTVSAFLLPYFRERKFLGDDSRLRPGPSIIEEAQYQSSQQEEHVDFALRYSHFVDIFDFGISYFAGTNRTPLLLPIEDDETLRLLPIYRQLEQVGLDFQATLGAWLFKLEAIGMKDDEFGRNTAAVGGFEYTFFTIANSNADLGIIVEYQFDDRTGLRSVVPQNDIAIGARYAFNDYDASEILALFAQDLDYDNRFFSLELSRRLTDNWKLEAEARIFSSVEAGTVEFDLRGDSYIQLDLRHYF